MHGNSHLNWTSKLIGAWKLWTEEDEEKEEVGGGVDVPAVWEYLLVPESLVGKMLQLLCKEKK